MGLGLGSGFSSSSAACTDHASLHGSDAAARMSVGEGATVDTSTERGDMAKACGCVG